MKAGEHRDCQCHEADARQAREHVEGYGVDVVRVRLLTTTMRPQQAAMKKATGTQTAYCVEIRAPRVAWPGDWAQQAV